MNGITIIEEHLCRQINLQGLIISGCLITLTCIVFLFLCWFMWKICIKTKTAKILCLICSMLIVVMCIVFWRFQINTYNITHMEYTVTIDNTVSFHEFYERYEIISENNGEYRIKER